MLDRTFMTRVLRNLLISRNHPFFAHFFVTERCNLRCRYCEVYKNPTPELDEEQCKRIIDRLAQMKIAVVSFTGGEPLLRKDICSLIDYAKRSDMLVKISSNGTLPLERYKELLETGVDSINISMDGMSGGSARPYSKMDGRILSTIDYMQASRGKKQLFVSALYYNGNGRSIKTMVEHMGQAYPGLEIFVQPVVGGSDGSFRSRAYGDVDIRLLRELEAYPNVTNPRYFNDHCEEYFASGRNYPWGCKAGRLFFDIKPDGAFWLCQDMPTSLNILDPDFMGRWKSHDASSSTSSCRGCTYSCYVVTQRSFELRNALTWYHYSKRL